VLIRFKLVLTVIFGVIVLTACAGDNTLEMMWAESENISLPQSLYIDDYNEITEADESPSLIITQSEDSFHTSVFTNPTSPDDEDYNDIIEDNPMETLQIHPELGRQPMIALTFDDGPGPLTLYIVDMLVRYGGYATFCVIGNRVERWDDVVLQIVESGNEVIGHSWNHQNFSLLNEDAIAAQILDTSAAIEGITGVQTPPIFRAPYGIVNTRVRNTSRELGYSILNWTIDSVDWRDRDADIIYERIMEEARDGAIVLLHDIHPTTIEAMERVIPSLIEQGFQLVTASYLIDYFYGGLVPGFEFRGLRPGETARDATMRAALERVEEDAEAE